MKKDLGFTLVELLVVISIIAILATVGVASFNVAQQSARDGRARSDVTNIAKSIETSRNSDPVTGTVAYTYSAANYTSDFKTAPAGKNAYCIKTGSSDVADPIAQDAWTTVCPGSDPAAGWSPVSIGISAVNYWKICTYLERNTSPLCIASLSQ